MLRVLLLSLVTTLPPAALLAREPAVAAPATQAVLVTGASTGIGRKITEKLAADGYFVYAGARKEADLKSLGQLKNVQPLHLDVTDQKDVDAALEAITKAGRGLYGLVNNAGVVTAGSVADTKWEELELVMAVNLFGPYRMTKAFEPLIIANKGRITNIGSISGIGASADLSAYAMSKHAMEAFTDSLAAQLSAQGVQVNIVEPGNYDSQIGKNATQRTGITSRFTDRSKYQEPDAVAAEVEHALFDPNPKRRYLVVPSQEEAEWTIQKQIQQLVQLNEGQPYSYDREALIKMLDAALAQVRPQGK